MSSTDSLGEFGHADDRLLERIELAVLGGRRSRFGALRHPGVSQPFGIVSQDPSKLRDLRAMSDDLGVLNRIDSLRQTNHKSIEFLR